jgi:hypothetical protein
LKIKYLKPVIFVALAISIAGPLLLANSTESKKVNIQETPTASTVVITTPETTITTVIPETTTTIPETTTTTTLVPVGSKCEELAPIALQAGWPQELLPEILTIAHRESRCQNIIEGHPKWNGHDSGPLQINQVWLDEIEAKYGTWEVVNDPHYNFAWAWEMYIWFEANRGCGFDPWYKTYACN